MKTNLAYLNAKKTTNIYHKEGLSYVTFKNIENTGIIKHCFTSRLGGVSEGFLSTMNMSFSRGDVAENVHENYKRICEAIGVEINNCVISDQVHKTNIKKVTNHDKGKGIVTCSDIIEIDGFITNEPNIPLVTLYADCVPLFFVDPKNKAIGLSHSGWKGTIAKIGQKTIEAMEQEFGTNPQEVIAAIGPSICIDCYEVSEDVAMEFQKSFTEDQCHSILQDKGNGKYQLDLHQANKSILLEAGLLEENIVVTDLCTCCNPEYFFSHRASGGKRGNLAAIMCLKS